MRNQIRPTMHSLLFSAILFTITIIQFQDNSQDPLEYRPREDPPNREEGIKPAGVRASGLELLSFISSRQSVNPGDSVVLRIKFYMPRDTNLFITAKEIRNTKFYLMKPLQHVWSQGWREFLPWPTNVVLNPLRLALDTIGLVGRLNHDIEGSGEIAPLIVYHSQPPTKIHKYTLHFQSQNDLSEVNYELYRVDDQDSILYQVGTQDSIMHNQTRDHFGGVPFSITINLLNQSAGYYRLVLDCSYQNMLGGPYRSYIFYHNPDVKEVITK